MSPSSWLASYRISPVPSPCRPSYNRPTPPSTMTPHSSPACPGTAQMLPPLPQPWRTHPASCSSSPCPFLASLRTSSSRWSPHPAAPSRL
uniref:Uncharacterized protein n=1 Tax=Arundo donax TaxID=35708 RepID=A0A0A9G7U2_ARUDO